MKGRFTILVSVIICSGLILNSCRTGHAQMPNIVVICVDDLGYGDLSCYGDADVPTPNVDKLANEGLLFTDAYATASICTPSRYSLLTGRYHWRSTTSWSVGKIKDVSIAPGDAGLIIDTSMITVPKVLKKKGYVSGVVGKWHLGLGPAGGPDWNGEVDLSPLDIGFDYSFIMPATADRVPCVFVENRHVVGLNPADPIRVSYEKPIGDTSQIYNPDVTPDVIVTYTPENERRKGEVLMQPSFGHDQTIINGIPRIGYMTGGQSALWKDDEVASTFAGKAIDFIDKNSKKPFFLYFATHDLHVPRVPNKAFAGKSKIGIYGDVIMQMDWTVGQILKRLDELKLTENTIVILTSDNGPVIDDGYNDGAYEGIKAHRPSGKYREGKYSAYEGGTRIPFIIRWPKEIKHGKSGAMFSQVDLLATLSDIVGNRNTDNYGIDSRAFKEVLTGKKDRGRDYVVIQNMNKTLSVIKGGWKYIEPSDKPRLNQYTRPVTDLGNMETPQLFNLSNDPDEEHNVAREYPDKLKEMELILADEKK